MWWIKPTLNAAELVWLSSVNKYNVTIPTSSDIPHMGFCLYITRLDSELPIQELLVCIILYNTPLQ